MPPLPGLDGCRIAGDNPSIARRETARRTGNAPGHPGEYGDTITNRITPERYMAEHPGEVLGRWPANVVLSHIDGPDGCRCVGVKRVKGSNGVRGASTHIYGGGKGFTGATGEKVGFADADGTETVEDWECARDLETGEYICPVRMLDEQSGERRAPQTYTRRATATNHVYGKGAGFKDDGEMAINYGDTGGASRFFYCSKASRRERWFHCRDCADAFPPSERPRHLHNHYGDDGKESWSHITGHPTQKSEALMRWLCRLITPPDGVILDPFAGSFSTGVAAIQEGFEFIGIEQDPVYHAIGEKRLAAARAELGLFA